VRVEPGSGTYTVLDAIAAVNPALEGDALSITPDNISAGLTNLVFQQPANPCQTLISLNFDTVSVPARVSTVGLGEFSSFAPVPGNVLNACQISLAPVSSSDSLSFAVDVGLSAGANYSGNGSDLHVLQWNGAAWSSPTFTFNAANNQAWVAGVTNTAAFVVAQFACPPLCIQQCANGMNFQCTAFAGMRYTLQRSTDLLNWAAVTNATPECVQSLTLQDTAPAAPQAFYRLLISQ
jgi:hypothetical protein